MTMHSSPHYHRVQYRMLDISILGSCVNSVSFDLAWVKKVYETMYTKLSFCFEYKRDDHSPSNCIGKLAYYTLGRRSRGY